MLKNSNVYRVREKWGDHGWLTCEGGVVSNPADAMIFASASEAWAFLKKVILAKSKSSTHFLTGIDGGTYSMVKEWVVHEFTTDFLRCVPFR